VVAGDATVGPRSFFGGFGEEVILADLVEELATADPQSLGRPGPVAVAGGQGSSDGTALDLGQEGSEREFLDWFIDRLAKKGAL